MDNDAADAARDAAAVAQVAAGAAERAAENAAEPEIDPNALIAADVAIAQQQEETERARIAARAEVKIAELQTEEPPWLSSIQASLTRLEERIEELANRQSSTPAIINAIATEPVAEPPEPENLGAAEAAPEEAPTEQNPAEPEPEPEPAAAPARQRRRWI